MKNSCWTRGFWGAIAAVLIAFVAMGPQVLSAQREGATGTPLTFEVATIKPDDPGKLVINELRVYPGGRLIVRGHSLRRLIGVAFDLPDWQMVGGEKWLEQTRFDIEGRPSEELRNQIAGGEYSNAGLQDPRIRSMLQALLIERFHLKFHMENQPGTVYRLERGSGTLRLEPVELKLYTKAEDGTVSPSRAYPTGDMGMASGAHVGLHQTSMHQLAFVLSSIQRVPVSDQTGLTDFYNFKSETVVTDEDFKNGGPMHLLADSLPEMGLRLVKTQGTVEKFVIDSAEMPPPN